MVLKATQDRAAAMGKRAGQAWQASGIPTANPFPADVYPDLAQSWRAAYLKASAK